MQLYEIQSLIAELEESDETAERVIPKLVGCGTSALSLLLDAIRNGPSSSQILLRQVILQMNPLELMDEVIGILEDEHPYVRSIAYNMLGKSRDPAVCSNLSQRVLDEMAPESDRVWAAKALGEFGIPTILGELRRVIEQIVEDESLNYQSELVISTSISMARLGDQCGYPYVLELSNHEDPTVRASAVKALRYLVGPGLLKRLHAALRDDYREIRIDAVDAMFYLGTNDALYAISELLEDEDPNVEQHVRLRVQALIGEELPETDWSKRFRMWYERNAADLKRDVCYRSGHKLRVSELVNQLREQPVSRELLVEELYTITGCRFGHDPEVWIYAEPIDYLNIGARWLKDYGVSYSDGVLYKFGFQQDLSTIVD